MPRIAAAGAVFWWIVNSLFMGELRLSNQRSLPGHASMAGWSVLWGQATSQGPWPSSHSLRDLAAWNKLAEEASWANFSSLKQTFGSADLVGECVVFDVGNHRYRVIARVSFTKGKVYIPAVMDHKEYDKKRWIDECVCRRGKKGR
jgi:mRNA-degrading endonuclease HigB of HigAB toxin-antitoxin module